MTTTPTHEPFNDGFYGQWFPVERFLPPENQDVLAFHPQIGRRLAYRMHGFWYWLGNSFFRKDPTHWAIIPPAPK